MSSMATEHHTSSAPIAHPETLAVLLPRFQEAAEECKRAGNALEAARHAAPHDWDLEHAHNVAHDRLNSLIDDILDAPARTLAEVRIKLMVAPYVTPDVVMASLQADLNAAP